MAYLPSRFKIGLHTSRLFKTVTGNELPYSKGNDTNRYKSGYERREQSENVIEKANEQCYNHKKLTMERSTEQSCLVDEMTCQRAKNCDPDDCDNKIPEEVFHADTPAMSKEEKQRQLCCKNSSLLCLSWEKTYPMRHAGAKPPIDGRPIIGQTWRRKKWGIKC